MKNKALVIPWLLLLMSYSCFFPPQGYSVEPSTKEAHTQSPSLHFACSPEKPMVFQGETIAVKTWITSPPSPSLGYTWLASGGKITSQKAEARWDFTGVKPGIYTLSIQVRKDVEHALDCSVRVIVRPRPFNLRGQKRANGRSFLLPKNQIKKCENKGDEKKKEYGLYSYLLFASRPSKESEGRYLKAITEYLDFPDADGLAKRLEDTQEISIEQARRKLNVTYLPIKTCPDAKVLHQVARGALEPAAKWVLEQYDYERARVILFGLDGNQRKGPYLISFLKPYRGKENIRPYLFQDQSWVPEHLVPLWMDAFLNQASQENFWEERTGVRLMRNIRTTIGVMAIGLPEVQKSLDNLITWVKKTL